MAKGFVLAVIVTTVTLGALLELAEATQGQQQQAPMATTTLTFSAGLAALLSEEMLAIEEGLGLLMPAIATGDWSLVAQTAEKIEKSYILAQQLTAEQIEELERVLPPRFEALDSAFHQSAGKLSKAARERDSELAIFHAYKLMEACVECHATYARGRFPGFDEEEREEGHEHH